MDLKIYTLAKKPATVTQQLTKSIDFRQNELYDFHLSQRKKIHRLAYRFSIDFKIYRLAYGFLCVNHKGLTKVYRFLVRAFFSQDFKNP